MSKKTMAFISGILVLSIAAVTLLYRPVIQPWHLRWGAGDAETQMALPGDEVVRGKANQSTRAIDIHAPIDQVWPWLLQLGQGRGGLFSYDFLENLAGCDIHTLNHIDNALQTLKVGNTIRIGKQDALPRYRVIIMSPQQALVLRSVDSKTDEMKNATWGFYLQEKSSTITRLIIRHRDEPAVDSTSKMIDAIFEPISFIMERGMLHGIRDHAEALYANSLK